MALINRAFALFHSVPYGTGTGKTNFYSYASPDALATIIAAGYFNNIRDKLAVNDQIWIVAAAGATAVTAIVKVTAAPASGNVTVAVLDLLGGTGVTGDNVVAALTAVALTDSSGGTAADTIPAQGASYVQATQQTTIASLARAINRLQADMAALRAALLASGFTTT